MGSQGFVLTSQGRCWLGLHGALRTRPRAQLGRRQSACSGGLRCAKHFPWQLEMHSGPLVTLVDDPAGSALPTIQAAGPGRDGVKGKPR